MGATDLRLEHIMDKEHVKGAADKAKGAIKEGVGKVTGDQKLQGEAADGSSANLHIVASAFLHLLKSPMNGRIAERNV